MTGEHLAAGSRLAAYVIAGPLGAGGMGEVYRARDTKLGREVAIKILPAAFALDAERVARFKREAQVLASLNHPHIAQIYGLEEANGTQVLVMELVDGESLDKRIARGPIPVDEALPIAKQIAEALEAAHEKGIIHRDLKPANIALTKDGQVKVLDFGLAKAVEAGDGGGTGARDLANSPTITSPAMLSGVGVILGTAAYMSPEQAKGRPADKRSDVWAFGCVLYEMLTGVRAFDGEDVADTLANVLRGQPDWSRLPSGVPTVVRAVLERCLDRTPTTRLSDFSTFRFVLVDLLPKSGDVSTSLTAARSPQLMLAVVVAAAILSAGIGWWSGRSRVAVVPAGSARFVVDPPPGATWPVGGGAPHYVVSPDGARLILTADDRRGTAMLWVRDLANLTPRLLRGTEHAQFPFWSPDTQRVAFIADGRLKIMDAGGGLPETVCATAAESGAWGAHGEILLSQRNSGLLRASLAEHTCSPFLKLDSGVSEQLWPQFLPDGEHFLFVSRATDRSSSGVYVASTRSTERHLVVRSDMRAVFGPPDRLLYVQDGVLVAQRFDLKTLTLTGDVVAVAEGMVRNPNGRSTFSASTNGVLVYRAAPPRDTARLTWFDVARNSHVPFGDAAFYGALDLSPDEKRAAVEIVDQPGAAMDIAVVDLSTKLSTRLYLASHGSGAFNPLWSPDGDALAFNAGDREIHVKRLDVTGSERVVAKGAGVLRPSAWLPDGKTLLYREVSADHGSNNIWAAAVGDSVSTPRLIMEAKGSEWAGSVRVSPDAHWMAYTSEDVGSGNSGRPFPEILARSAS